MYSFADPLFWLNGIYFFIAVMLAYFIPGQLVTKKCKLDPFSSTVTSIVIGFVLWSLLGFFLGFLHIRDALYLYIGICFFLWVKGKHYRTLLHRPKKIDLLLGIPLFLGTLVQVSSIWMTGILDGNGVYFCCGIPDTISHIGLTYELVARFPPQNPGFYGIPLQNYHYLSHLAIADLVRIFRLPLIATQYQYTTLLWSVLLGLSGITFAKAIKKDRQFMFWFIFFLYFCGDILFLLPFMTGNGFQFSLTTLENAATLWISPPRFFALVILMTGLTFFVHWLEKKDWRSGILMALLLSSLVGVKAYIGIFVLSGFFFLGLYYLGTKNYARIFPLFILAALSSLLWAIVNKESGGLVFSGFWRFEDFIVQPVLGLSHLELARRIFLDHHNIIRAFSYDLLFAFLYIFFSAGTLLLGCIQTKRSLQSLPKELHIVLVTGLVTTCIAGFFFLQKTGGANSSQFLMSIYIVGSIYASLAISWWMRKFPLPLLLLISAVIIIGTSTRVVYGRYWELQRIRDKGGIYIAHDTMRAYQFFNQTEKDSVILLYDDTTVDCLFITFVGKRETHTCTSGLPGAIPDQIIAEKYKERQTMLFETDVSAARKELLKNTISYIFIPKKYVDQTTIPLLAFPIVFENETIAIYKVE